MGPELAHLESAHLVAIVGLRFVIVAVGSLELDDVEVRCLRTEMSSSDDTRWIVVNSLMATAAAAACFTAAAAAIWSAAFMSLFDASALRNAPAASSALSLDLQLGDGLVGFITLDLHSLGLGRGRGSAQNEPTAFGTYGIVLSSAVCRARQE